MPIRVGAQGIIKKGTDKCINNIPGSLSLHKIQKIVLCGTAHPLRKILMGLKKNQNKRKNNRNT